MQDQSNNPQREFRQWNSTLKRKAPPPKQRKPIANSSKPIPRNKKPKPQSDKRRSEAPLYAAIVKERMGDEFSQDKPECEAKLQGICTWFATENHHAQGRGIHYLDTSKMVKLCHNCHEWATEHSKEAVLLSISISRTQLDDNQPVSNPRLGAILGPSLDPSIAPSLDPSVG